MSLKEIHATEEIMRIAINGQNHVDSLIGYYRDCIDKFNDERAQWSLYYEACKQNVSNKHLLERQLAQINSKKVDSQNQLSALKGELTYERQKYFQKIEQNQRIKDTLEENKKRFKQLTQVCKPLGIQNSRAKSAFSVKTNAFQSGQKALFKNQKINQQQGLSQLQFRLINLDRQHGAKKEKLLNCISNLKQQLDDLVSEHSDRGQECSQQYKIVLNRLTDLQSKNQNLISEFFKFRLTGQQEEQRIQQQNQVIRLKNMALAQKLKQLQNSHSEQFKSVQSQVKRKNKQFQKKYDEQLKKKQQHLSILKEQHERISDIYLNKLKKMQAQLRLTTEKSKTIQQKTKIQVSSLKSQIKILTNRLENVAMNHMKKDLAPNNEQSEQESSATLQMEELERINNEVKDLQKQLDKKKEK